MTDSERKLLQQAQQHKYMLKEQMAKEHAERIRLQHQRELEMHQQREAALAEKQRQEKIEAYRRFIAEFTKVDDKMILPNFYRIVSPENYKHELFDDERIRDFSGIYIIANASKKKIYVGQGKTVIKRCYEHFRNRESSRDNVPQVREDILNGDIILINFVKITTSGFDTLDELERYYVDYYDCREPNGYNHVKPPSTNRTVRRVNQSQKYYMYEYVENEDIVYSDEYKQSGTCKSAAEVTCRTLGKNVRLFSSDGIDRYYYGKWMNENGNVYYVRSRG